MTKTYKLTDDSGLTHYIQAKDKHEAVESICTLYPNQRGEIVKVEEVIALFLPNDPVTKDLLILLADHLETNLLPAYLGEEEKAALDIIKVFTSL